MREESIQKMNLIILAAGKVNRDYVSVFNTSPAMLTFNGDPLIYQMILSFSENFSGKVIVALPKGEERIEKFLKQSLSSRVVLQCIFFENAQPYQQASTLQKCSEYLDENFPCIVAHGDIFFDVSEVKTLIDRSPDQMIAFVKPGFENDKYSGFVLYSAEDTGKTMVRYVPSYEKNVCALIDCGIYYLPSLKALKKNAVFPTTIGHYLVDLVPDNLVLEEIEQWLDLGHIDNASKIKYKVLGTRNFNSLVVDEEKGIITKRSSKRVKILEEINYYLKLPKKLEIYFPRLLDFKLGDEVEYSIEYYPYKTLSEYYTMYSLPLHVWHRLFNRLFRIYDEFLLSQTCTKVSSEDVKSFYLEKLKTRLEMAERQRELSLLLSRLELTINQKRCPGWRYYKKIIEDRVEKISMDTYSSVIHGDLCFSNILYDPGSGLIKFIDPRGAFFEQGIQGDSRYDMAKLLHSIHGYYDFIVHKLYTLKETNDGDFELEILYPEGTERVKELFKSELNKRFSKSQVIDLLVLEAMLFLTMLPLHSDDLRRQKAFYIIALLILREVKIMMEGEK